MTRKKHEAREALREAADELVAELWEGKWNHIPEISSRPISDLDELFNELERRAPGHSRSEYADAFSRSYINNR